MPGVIPPQRHRVSRGSCAKVKKLFEVAINYAYKHIYNNKNPESRKEASGFIGGRGECYLTESVEAEVGALAAAGVEALVLASEEGAGVEALASRAAGEPGFSQRSSQRKNTRCHMMAFCGLRIQ